MAIFTTRDISKGEELCHSYVPAYLLLPDADERGKHLHFVCKCERCESERAGVGSSVSMLGFPAQHVNTEAGRDVAAFKMACVLSDQYTHSASDSLRILTAGDKVIGCESWFFFESHPVAVLEIVVPYLSAAFGALLSGEDGLLQSTDRRSGLRTASRLFLSAIIMLREREGGTSHTAHTFRTHAHAIPIPAQVLEQLTMVGAVQLYVLGGGLLRRQVAPLLLESLRVMKVRYGGSLDCLREDLACLSTCGAKQPEPKLEDLVMAVEKSAAGAAGSAALSISLSAQMNCDECALCSKREVAGAAILFSRCSQCKLVKVDRLSRNSASFFVRLTSCIENT